MSFHKNQLSSSGITTFQEFIRHADYSLRTNLNPDPASSHDGDDHRAREVCSGHYVPVNPTPLPDPIYITHSYHLFKDLGLHDVLVEDQNFRIISNFFQNMNGNGMPGEHLKYSSVH